MAEPQFVQLPDRSLILRGAPPPPKTAVQSLKAALAGFMDAFRPAPPQAKPFWIPQQTAPASMPAQATASPAPASAPGLPAYNAWSEVEKEVAERNRIVDQLGEFPQRMMASPLVEGKLWK